MTSPTQAVARARATPWSRRRRRPLSTESVVTTAMCLFSLTVGVLVYLAPTYVPFTSLTLPIVVGSILLSPRTLPWFVVFDVAVLAFCVSQQVEITSRTIGAVLVQLAIAAVVMASSFKRARLGVAGLRGESMFVDLRDRIVRQGAVPALPPGWTVETAQESAGGSSFAGDFVVAAAADGRVDVVVVDVSGKGEDAGTRALLLSGAFSGMLGALPHDRFLAAANDYLLRQAWEEGFATAVHLSVDLATGDYEVRSAGHPPAGQRVAAERRWEVLAAEGPLLGVVEGIDYVPVTGRLGAGDAVVLYTDGLVEEPRRDIEQGISHLLEEAELLLGAPDDARGSGPDGGAAAQLARRLGSKDDDRAVVLLRRD